MYRTKDIVSRWYGNKNNPLLVWNVIICQKIKSALDNPRCPKIQDDKRRIEFILKMIDSKQMREYISELFVIQKSAKISSDFRDKGNSFYNSTVVSKLDKAVEEYTKSVAHAPPRSQELALAYANRSAVLFKARLISDCLLDIERALQNNYPDNLKAKLYLRKAMCLQILKSKNDSSIKMAFTEARKWVKEMDGEKQKIMEEILTEQENISSIDKFTFSKWDYKKFIPKLSAENPMIPGLSDAVELQYSEKYGRHIVATRDIEPGEVIAVQKAYSAVITVDSRYKFCWNCSEQTWASIPCENCVEVVFCSEICREKAMLEHHEIECPVIASIVRLHWFNDAMMPLRIMIKGLKEMDNSFETWKKNLEKIDAEQNPLRKGFTNNVLEPNNFSSVYVLSADLEIRTMFTEENLYSSIVLAFLLATKTRYFGSKMSDNLRTLSSEENFIFVVGLLEKVILVSRNILPRNHLQVKEYRLVPALSFFNHCCNLMVIRTIHNDYMAIRALLPIKKNEQIFDTLGPNYTIMPKNVRRTYLLSLYNFSCDCEACENNWQIGLLEKSQEREGKSMDPLVEEAKLLFHDSKAKAMAIRRQRNVDFNVEKDVARMSTALKKFYRFNRPTNSFEISLVQMALFDQFDLTQNRLLSLD